MKTKLLSLFVAVMAVFFGNGCVLLLVGGAAAAGAGAVMYVDGELKADEATSLVQANKATLATLKDLQFALVGNVASPLQIKLTVRTSTDQKIVITLNKQSETVTEIRVRVGTFGDEPLSRTILDKIKTHL